MKNGDNQSTASRRTLIDEGTEIKGQIDSACAIVVMGKVEGGLTGPSLYVTDPEGNVVELKGPPRA